MRRALPSAPSAPAALDRPSALPPSAGVRLAPGSAAGRRSGVPDNRIPAAADGLEAAPLPGGPCRRRRRFATGRDPATAGNQMEK